MSAHPPSPPPESLRLSRKQMQEVVAAQARNGTPACAQPACTKRIWVGLFFDGTNNNKDRDRPTQAHSNIARLFDAFPDVPEAGLFAHYIPGVGTPFPEIGEVTESAGGKRYGRGGAARIHWGLIQVLNAPHYAVAGAQLVSNGTAKTAINSYGQLKDAWSVFDTRRRTWFGEQVAKLGAATRGRKPTILEINLSIFGFSRGAAEARACVNWLLECCEKKGNRLTLAGMPLRIQFLGLFDTVASVGFADSFPGPVNGHFDWADGTMRIPGQVERCVHLVAGHEIRASFPLNCGRDGKSYPANVTEVVYPGAHSDLGGGYAPNDQGRSRQGAASLMSQLPLARMYTEARTAGVPLVPFDQMKDVVRQDFEIHPELHQSFTEYLKHADVRPARVEHMLEAHMRHYRRYKAVTADWETESLRSANSQDRQDLKESSDDFKREMRQLKHKETLTNQKLYNPLLRIETPNPFHLSEREKQLLEDLRSPVHQTVIKFLDNYVHDSHAGFYLAGPVTQYDKDEEIKRVKQMVQDRKSLNRWEQKVWEAVQQRKPFPLMTDADQWDMLTGSDGVFVAKLVSATTDTRRESDAHLRQRVVFDQS